MNKVLWFSLFILLFFSGCKRYEENERVSFLTAKNRLVGKWKQVMPREDPSSQTYHTTTIVFRADYTFLVDENYPNFYLNQSPPTNGKSSPLILTRAGTWDFTEGKKVIRMDYNGNKLDEYWEISKLTSKDFSFSLQTEPSEKVVMVQDNN